MDGEVFHFQQIVSFHSVPPLTENQVDAGAPTRLRLLTELFQRPIQDVPEDAHPVVPQHRVRRDALQAVVRHIKGVDVTEEGVGRVLGQFFLELGIGFLPLLGVVGLTASVRYWSTSLSE